MIFIIFSGIAFLVLSLVLSILYKKNEWRVQEGLLLSVLLSLPITSLIFFCSVIYENSECVNYSEYKAVYSNTTNLIPYDDGEYYILDGNRIKYLTASSDDFGYVEKTCNREYASIQYINADEQARVDNYVETSEWIKPKNYEMVHLAFFDTPPATITQASEKKVFYLPKKG